MTSKDILEYYDWIKRAQVVIEDCLLNVHLHMNDPSYPKDTDELVANGYRLLGQNIEINGMTGQVFIKTDLLTFAKWLEQKEKAK